MIWPSLKTKAIKGVSWDFLGSVISQGVTFAIGIVLARLLSPNEYGLIGIAMIIIAISNCLVDGGLSVALIRKADITDRDCNTVFYSNIIVSVVLFIIVFLGAPAIAAFFKRPELESITRVMGLCLIINAFSIIQSSLFSKQIDFKAKSISSIVSATIGGGVGIIFAILGYGAWALVFQQLMKQLVNTFILWRANQWRPKLEFSISCFSELWGFGWKMMASSLLDTIASKLADIIAGKCYSPETLGQYSHSRQLCGAVSGNLTTLVQHVGYPILCEVKDNSLELRNVFVSLLKISMFVSTVCLFLLGAISEPLVFCLLGPKWHIVSTYLPFMCLAASLYPMHLLNLVLLGVQGRSDLFLKLEIIKKIIAIPELIVGIYVGIIPMLLVDIWASVIIFFLNAHWSEKIVEYSSVMQFKDVMPSYGIASLVALSVYFLKFIPVSFWIILPLQLLVGGLALLMACKVFKIEEYDKIKRLAISYLRPNTN